MASINCPECKREISDTARSCPHCGYSFEKMKFCKFCGVKIPEDSIVCTKCGRQVENTTSGRGVVINNVANASANASVRPPYPPTIRQPKQVDKVVALILCILFGYLGAHKFYEGSAGMGLLYLFTFGLFGIGWFVDIIIIATRPNPYYV